MKHHLPTFILEPRTWRYLLLQEFKKEVRSLYTLLVPWVSEEGGEKGGVKGFSHGGIWQLCTVNSLWNSSLPNSHLNTWYRFPILSWKSAPLEGWPGSVKLEHSKVTLEDILKLPTSQGFFFFCTDISLFSLKPVFFSSHLFSPEIPVLISIFLDTRTRKALSAYLLFITVFLPPF